MTEQIFYPYCGAEFERSDIMGIAHYKHPSNECILLNDFLPNHDFFTEMKLRVSEGSFAEEQKQTVSDPAEEQRIQKGQYANLRMPLNVLQIPNAGIAVAGYVLHLLPVAVSTQADFCTEASLTVTKPLRM